MVASVVKNDHIRPSSRFPTMRVKCRRPNASTLIDHTCTPAQHAQFLQHASNTDFTNPGPTASSDPAVNAQAEFDHFYMVAKQLLEQYYPEKVVTMTSRDPEYITPRIKAMLRRRNGLMRNGRVEEAGALSNRVGQTIQHRCRTQLSRYNSKTDVGSMWAAVRRLTGRPQPSVRVDGITAETLNEHYAKVSSDLQNVAPAHKLTTAEPELAPQCLSEWGAFHMLDTLHPTAAGLDGLPAWFLRVAAPVIYKLIAQISICLSTHPQFHGNGRKPE